MLFIYPNGPKSTNENMLWSLFYMPFIFFTDRIDRMNERKKREETKKRRKKNDKNTHKLTRIHNFFFFLAFARSVERTQNFLGVYTCFCVWHAGREFVIYLCFFLSLKFIIRLSSLCKSLLVFPLVMFHPLYNDDQNNKSNENQ